MDLDGWMPASSAGGVHVGRNPKAISIRNVAKGPGVSLDSGLGSGHGWAGHSHDRELHTLLAATTWEGLYVGL